MNIEEKFFEGIAYDIRESDNKFHVSLLCYDCMRNLYYRKTLGEFMDANGMMTVWIGKQLHLTPILKSNELRLEWTTPSGAVISGTLDDYEDGIIIEKKTTGWKVERPKDYNVRQLEYQALLLSKHNMPFTEGHLLYIDIGKKDLIPFQINIRELAEIEAEVLEKVRILEEAFKNKIAPPRVTGWLCSYCVYASRCFGGRA